jgi:hypothetical protein
MTSTATALSSLEETDKLLHAPRWSKFSLATMKTVSSSITS